MAAVLLMVVLALLLGACSEEGSGVTLPEGVDVSGVTLPEVEVPDVEVPAPEPAPEAAPAPDPAPEAEDDGSSAPLWLVVILAIIIIGFIAYFGARSGGKKESQPAPAQTPPPPPAAPTPWKEAARSAYAEARWLYDEMDVELATWRGDTLYEAQISRSTAAINTAHQSTWNQLPTRLSAARDALYRVESTAGDPHVAQIATTLADNLNTTRQAVDRLAAARRSRRAAEDDGSDAGAIDEARHAESRAADDLAADRRRLGDATSNLSSAI
jgi:hypothetical protein